MMRVLRWFVLIAALEAISWLTVFHPMLNSASAAVAALLVLALAYVAPASALSLLVMEFVIGSKGGLLRLMADAQGNGGVSLRVLWFTAFFVGWMFHVMEERSREDFLDLTRFFWREWKLYFALAALLLFAFVRGRANGHPFVLADANAWGALLLLIPIVDLARAHGGRFFSRVSAPLLAGLAWLFFETFFLFYFFSHGFPDASRDVYLWIRRTGVGEVTRILPGQDAFRIFFQSHLYALFAVFGGLALLADRERPLRRGLLPASLGLAVILISFSRSLWIGLATGFFVFFGWMLAKRKQEIARWLFRWLIAAAAAVALVFVLLRLPFPRVEPGALSDLMIARADAGEAAVGSRWNLLPVLWKEIKKHPLAGNGFGATATYQSKDPRVVRETGGSYTTYAFEWGWLDLWMKMGVLIIPLFALIFTRLGRIVWRSDLPDWQRLSAICSLVALVIVHFFTPYVNHPLGLLFLMLMECWIVARAGMQNRPLPDALPVAHVRG